jgi:hypothetical protein
LGCFFFVVLPPEKITMKKFYIALAALTATTGFAQTTLFSENMGTLTGNVLIPAYEAQAAPATFQNSAAFTFSGTADVRSSMPSDTYAGASGSGLVFLAAVLPSKTFQIDGINTLNYTDLTLSFGQHKGTNAGSNEMTVEVSDGVTWTPLTYTRAAGGGTSVWILVTPTGTIPSAANLSIRFTNPTNSTTPLSVGFRIDDIKLVGTPVPLSAQQSSIAGLKIYPNPANTVLNITSDSFEAKHVVIYNVLGKVVLTAKATNAPVNVAALSSGVYIVKVTEAGKSATRKLVIE